MEILSQSTDWWIFIPLMILFAGASVFFGAASAYGIYLMFREGPGDGNLIATVVVSVITAFLITITVLGIKEGPYVTYKAIVTDYNVVYDEGYEIISTDGKIVTLTKGTNKCRS